MSTSGQMGKQNIVHTYKESYLAMWRNEVTMIKATAGIERENIMLSERSQSQNFPYYVISFTGKSRRGDCVEIQNTD